jgi:hypothetical protein
MYERRGPVSIDSLREPEFIYEKGVPRKNPKYKTIVEPHTFAHNASVSSGPTRQLTPFVSMILDTGVVPPPIVVLKSHDAKLEEHNHILHNIVRQLDDIQSNKNVDRKEGRHAPNNATDATDATDANDANDANDATDGEEDEELLMDVVMNDLTNSREFVEGIVNKIVNETNLSEVIMKIEPLVKENQELRSLIHSQQQMMNEMNTMLLRLLNNNNNNSKEDEQVNELDEDGLYQPEMSPSRYEERLEYNVDAETEAVTEAVTEADADAHAEADADAHAVTEAEDNIVSLDPNDQDLDYSTPHFPEPVSLIVTDIQSDS